MDTTNFNGIEVTSVIQSLKPKGENWMELPVSMPTMAESITATSWINRQYGFFVISAVEKADQGDGIDRGPEYHLSFTRRTSRGPERVDTNEANWILKEFGLEGAEEDNHVPYGKARNFWRTVREDMVGLECACKDEEPKIRENKGDYIWRPAA